MGLNGSGGVPERRRVRQSVLGVTYEHPLAFRLGVAAVTAGTLMQLPMYFMAGDMGYHLHGMGFDGLVRRTIYAARYLSDPAYRRRITRQLNKGESLHGLRRDLCYAHEGQIRHRYHEDQSEQALCLTVVTAMMQGLLLSEV